MGAAWFPLRETDIRPPPSRSRTTLPARAYSWHVAPGPSPWIPTRNVPILGVAFVGDAVEDSEATIAEMGRVKRLGRLPWIDPLDPVSLTAAFAENFNITDFA